MFIYIITNTQTGEQYVGQKSKMDNWDRYWGSGYLIKKAIKQLGTQCFTKAIVENNIATQSDLNERERYWIQYYNTMRPNGYNLSSGGECVAGRRHSEETKRKIGQSNAIALIGVSPSKAARQKISKKLTGRKLSDETKRKISAARKGMRFSENHIENMRLSRYGKHPSEETRRKRAASMMGKKHTPESIQKMKTLASKRMSNLDIRKQISQSLMGHTVSEETKQKIRATLYRTRQQKTLDI